jgi:membrane-bound acyltransferase YfiQ involved in biofilm formation
MQKNGNFFKFLFQGTLDNVLLAVLIGFFIIAIHQTLVYGFMYSYWLYMIVLLMLLLLQFRRSQRQKKEPQTPPISPKKATAAKKKNKK